MRPRSRKKKYKVSAALQVNPAGFSVSVRCLLHRPQGTTVSQKRLLRVEKENTFLRLLFFISCLGLVRIGPMGPRFPGFSRQWRADVYALTGSSKMSAYDSFSLSLVKISSRCYYFFSHLVQKCYTARVHRGLYLNPGTVTSILDPSALSPVFSKILWR